MNADVYACSITIFSIVLIWIKQKQKQNSEYMEVQVITRYTVGTYSHILIYLSTYSSMWMTSMKDDDNDTVDDNSADNENDDDALLVIVVVVVVDFVDDDAVMITVIMIMMK